MDISLAHFVFTPKKLLFATNDFASQLTDGAVKKARAQVFITEPIKNLKTKGTFHLNKGCYYFWNVGDRILLVGERNLDFNSETATEFSQTEIVQNKLEELLKEVILPHHDFEIAHSWSGIMSIENSKKPIVSELSENLYYGVRLGGMGLAIGSVVGQELADLI